LRVTKDDITEMRRDSLHLLIPLDVAHHSGMISPTVPG
jgi:hypothetical protein